MPRRSLLPYAEAAAAAALWGTLGVAFRVFTSMGADAEWLIAGRPLVASLIGAAIARRPPSMWSLATGALGLAPLYVAYFLAVERVGAGLAAVLLYTAPIWAALFSMPIGEWPGWRDAAAVVAGFAGAALIAAPRGDSAEPLGIALGLASGASYAFYMVLTRVALTRGASAEEASLLAFPFAAAAVLAIIHPGGAPGLIDVAGMLYLGVFCTIIPYVLAARSLSRLPAYRFAVVGLVEPITALALGYLLLGERLSTLDAMGAALVLVSATAALPRR